MHATGKPFMHTYDPIWKDLAPRDVVARAIYHEMLDKNVPNVYLDLRSYIPEHRIREHFPTIYAECLKYGIDLTTDLVPVVPGAHYACGGVWVPWGGQLSTGSMRWARSPAPGCMAPIVWPVRVCLRAWCGATAWPARFRPILMICRVSPATISPLARYEPWHARPCPHPTGYERHQTLDVELCRVWSAPHHVSSVPYASYATWKPKSNASIAPRPSPTASLACVTRRTAVVVAMAAWSNKTSMGCHYRE